MKKGTATRRDATPSSAAPAPKAKQHRRERHAEPVADPDDARFSAESALKTGLDILSWIIAPPADAGSDGSAMVDTFMAEVLEAQPLHFTGRQPTHFAAASTPSELQPVLPMGVEWSSAVMLAAVQRGKLRYGTDINVVKFDPKLKKRVPLKTEGLVTVEEYKRALQSGWSVRFLRPQEHAATLSTLLFYLDEALGCSTGMNSYWTPKGSQGFAPHFDDVDVFMLQLEGSKRWRVYPPPRPEDDLCRVSSPDFKPDDLPPPVLDVVLKAGEVLYLPRGWVHQGITSETEHSLHLTVSAFQNHTYGDLLRRILLNKLDVMCNTDRELRRALPPMWWHVLGSRFNAKVMGPFAADVPAWAGGTASRAKLISTIRGFAATLTSDVATKDGIIDKGADLFAVDVLERRQPVAQTSLSATATATAEEDASPSCVGPEFQYRLASPAAAKLVIGAEEVQLHHCGGNSVVCLGPTDIPTSITYDVDYAPALVQLVTAHPKWIAWDAFQFPCAAESTEAEEELNELRAALLQPLVASRVLEVRRSNEAA